MSKDKLSFAENRDVYLEMLWKAQVIEDHKLIGLLHQRLKTTTHQWIERTQGGVILPFPCTPLRVPLPPAEPASLWPRKPAFQSALLFSGYCALVLIGHFIF